MKLSQILLFLAVGAATLPAQTATTVPKRVRIIPDNGAALPQQVVQSNSLVKVNATSQPYSLHMPWQKESPSGRRGLGVVLSGNRVLVTGQMVADATYIELELPTTGQKLPAKVLAVDYEANLALLESAPSDKQKAFFAGLKPMAVDSGSTPAAKSEALISPTAKSAEA